MDTVKARICLRLLKIDLLDCLRRQATARPQEASRLLDEQRAIHGRLDALEGHVGAQRGLSW